MNVIFILIAVSLMVAMGFLISFIWSIRAGQYDDEYTPSVRILFDDETNIIDEENSIRQTADQIPDKQKKPNTRNQEPMTKNQEPGTRNQEPIPNNK